MGRCLTPKRVLTSLAALIALLMVINFGIGWYFSSVLYQEALEIRQDRPAFNLLASTAGDDLVRLEQGPEGGEWTLPGRWGIAWDGGNGMLGEITSEADDHLIRRFTLTNGALPQSSPAQVLSNVYPADPLGFLGVDYEVVQYEAPLGRQDTWQIDGVGDTWALFVHGLRDGPQEGLPALSVLSELGIPSLLLTYRNDPGQPLDPSGRHQYGLTEWHDLQAAVEYALSQPEAANVVLLGNSMGGAIITKFLYESPLADTVQGVVLDSPALDLNLPVDKGARDRNLPGFVTATAKWVTTLRFGMDWDAVDHLKDAAQLSAPILLIHCADDGRVPIETSDALARQRPDLVQYSVYEQGGHVDAWYVDSARYESELKEFLLSVTR